jgi:hypothetical protein
MAAERLTKARLAQIITIMMVLVVAFTYRTFTYNKSNTVICQPNTQCIVEIEGKTITFMYQESTKLLKFTKSEDLTIEPKNTEGILKSLAKESSLENLSLPIYLKITSQTGSIVNVVIE